MNFIQIIVLALVQGAAELLPVSSSAHVIVVEKWMGLDPSSPEMTFFLVMLHAGTMVAVILYFWPRWKKLKAEFWKMAIFATGVTGVLGLGLKFVIEKVVLGRFMGESRGEIELLFKSLPLMAGSLFFAGILIIFAGLVEKKAIHKKMTLTTSGRVGAIQGLCLPFRGFSRSGATISVSLLSGVTRTHAEDFSFALAVLLTPPVILREFLRLHHELQQAVQTSSAASGSWQEISWMEHLLPGFLGMIFSFMSGLLALRCLSAVLDRGSWKYFGIYCILASVGVLATHWVLG